MMKAHLAQFFALLLICTGAALAQGTPDFMTPSQETICDGESGAFFLLPVTPEEGSACVQLILDSCTPE